MNKKHSSSGSWSLSPGAEGLPLTEAPPPPIPPEDPEALPFPTSSSLAAPDRKSFPPDP